MTLLFADDLHDEFGTIALGFAPYGGADVGEVAEIADQVGDGDDDAFYAAWSKAGDRLAKEARDADEAGRVAAARESYLRAACFYAVAYHPLFRAPVDNRLRDAFDKQIEAFDRAVALLDRPGESFGIALDGAEMPAYFLPAAGGGKRPLLISTNGYDATVSDMFFGIGRAATERGYHCLLFDGPGQGRMLFHDGVPIRPDWENVVRPVVDAALERDDVDADRIALTGWSFGGYLAPRAASGEPRLAALIADPGLPEPFDQMRKAAAGAGMSAEDVAALPDVDESTLKGMEEMIESVRGLRWRIIDRAFFVHGVNSLAGYMKEFSKFTVGDRVKDIRCPTLIAAAENDVLSTTAKDLYDALTCPKQLIEFTAAEGAGAHCEMLNRSLYNRRVFDWLDETLKPAD